MCYGALGHHSFINNCIGAKSGTFVIKLSKCSKYASLLKRSIAFFEIPDWRIFLMKDLAAMEKALRIGADISNAIASNNMSFDKNPR